MNPEDLVDATTYRRTKIEMQLKWSDSNELIVAWPHAIAPATHLDACREGLTLVRAHYASGGAR